MRKNVREVRAKKTRHDIICSITFMGETYALEISNILKSIDMSVV